MDKISLFSKLVIRSKPIVDSRASPIGIQSPFILVYAEVIFKAWETLERYLVLFIAPDFGTIHLPASVPLHTSNSLLKHSIFLLFIFSHFRWTTLELFIILKIKWDKTIDKYNTISKNPNADISFPLNGQLAHPLRWSAASSHPLCLLLFRNILFQSQSALGMKRFWYLLAEIHRSQKRWRGNHRP